MCAWEGGRARSHSPGPVRPRGPVSACAGLAARTSRRGKLGLEEVEEAGEEVEEGLLDGVERGVAEGRPQWLLCGHHGRASVGRPSS